MASSFRIRPEARTVLVDALGYGLLNFGLAFETGAKAKTPVRGGFRSFQPDGPVGGTLRRSIHTIAFAGGREVGRHVDPDANPELPDYVPTDKDAVVFIGTNSGYGRWVHDGTSRMPARPFFDEELSEIRAQAGAFVAAGSRKRLGQR